MRNSFVLVSLLCLTLSVGCSSEEDRSTVSASPRTSFKKYGKLPPIHSGFRSKQNSSKHIKKLINRFNTENESIRQDSLEEIVEIGRDAVQFLEAALGHKSNYVREYCCLALGRISRMPGSFMFGKLVKLLDDKKVRIQRACCFAIGHIGTSDTAVAKKVFALIASPDPTLRSYAAECLRKLKYWPAIPALIFNHLDPKKGKGAVSAKGKAKGKGAKSPAASLDWAIGNELTDPLRAYAADALAHMTHTDFGTDYRMWRKWWIYNQDRYTSDWD